MPCPLLTQQNLGAGIQKFLNHPKWRQDFHNLFYTNVTAAVKRTASISVPSVGAYVPAGTYGPTTWHDIVFELRFWRAMRPLKRALFFNHPGLPNLQAAYAVIGAGLPYSPMLAANPPQSQIKDLFDNAAVLKPVNNNSPVFASKCCHMILPWEYPVWDNEFVGNTSARMLESLDDWGNLNAESRQCLSKCLRQKRPDYWCYRYYLLLAWGYFASSTAVSHDCTIKWHYRPECVAILPISNQNPRALYQQLIKI
jgi:hypothetical protein